MKANTQLLEHRWGIRMELGAAVELRTLAGLVPASVRDASLSGAFLETPMELPLLSHIALRPLQKADDWLDACVVRIDSHGMAIEWLEPGLHPVYVLLSNSGAENSSR